MTKGITDRLATIDWIIDSAQFGIIIDATTNHQVADFASPTISDHESLANAALAAGAPRLYRALTNLLPIFCEMLDDLEDSDNSGSHPLVVEAVAALGACDN